jgi:hypothetical protein
MQTCPCIIVGDRGGQTEVAQHLAQTVSIYERMALLLTKKLLGDNRAAAEVDMLLFGHKVHVLMALMNDNDDGLCQQRCHYADVVETARQAMPDGT